MSGRRGAVALVRSGALSFCLSALLCAMAPIPSEGAPQRKAFSVPEVRLTDDEAFAIAISEADAIVAVHQMAVFDTLVHSGALADGRPLVRQEYWLTGEIQQILKRNGDLRPGGAISALVWPENEALPLLRAPNGANRQAILFLRRHVRAIGYQDPIASSVPWIVVGSGERFIDGILWADDSKIEARRTALAKHIAMQETSQLARRADVIVQAVPVDPILPSPSDQEETCIRLMVNRVLVGNVDTPALTVCVRGFGLPRIDAVYMLNRRTDGAYEILGKRAGVISSYGVPAVSLEAWRRALQVIAEEARR